MAAKKDYTKSRALAERLIAKYGQAGAIRRATVTGGDPFNPGSGTETVTYHDCTLVVLDYDTMERANSAIGMSDKKVLIAPDAEVEPTSADRLVIGMTAAEAAGALGAEIVNLDPLSPAGTVVTWEVQVRL